MISIPNKKEKIIYSNSYYSGDYEHTIYIKQANNLEEQKPRIYIIATTNIDGKEIKQGYIYFYLDEQNKISEFIGLQVNEPFRNLNIGSLLISIWIDFCLNNGYEILNTNKKQGKPFLIYLLKTYGFEIPDTSLYETSLDLITLYKSMENREKSKLILFKSKQNEQRFIKTNIFNTDNYKIVHSSSGLIKLTDIIMPLQSYKEKGIIYSMTNQTLASKKTEEVLRTHKK